MRDHDSYSDFACGSPLQKQHSYTLAGASFFGRGFSFLSDRFALRLH